MFGFLKKLFPSSKNNPERYAQEKEISQSGDTTKRLTLARSSKTNQEILYYLAENDPDPSVRKAVALNSATPAQANALLAEDVDEDVRLALAERLVTLLPNLEESRQSQLYAFAVQALGTLALDEVLKIRRALASTLKDFAHAPPKVVGQLARDLEKEVSEPILRFCAAVSDGDLLDILKEHPASWAVQAIAGRDVVSAPVSVAVIDSDDTDAGTILIENKGAEITKSLTETIIKKAKHYPEWQKPMASHKMLSSDMATILAEYADNSVRDILLQRADFDKKAIENITEVFQRRLAYMDNEGRSDETPLQRAKRLYKKNILDEEILSDALGLRDSDFVYAALACMANTTLTNVQKIFGMKAPKPIVALAWRAGLSMRVALRLQQELGQVPHAELLYPRGGTDYPLTEDEILWQLDFLGLEAA